MDSGAAQIELRKALNVKEAEVKTSDEKNKQLEIKLKDLQRQSKKDSAEGGKALGEEVQKLRTANEQLTNMILKAMLEHEVIL